MTNLNHVRKDYWHYLDQAEGILSRAEGEGRELTADERRKFDLASGKAEELARQISEAERNLRAAGLDRSDFNPMQAFFGGAAPSGRHFRSLGEQLKAIVQAGTPGGKVDERLHQVTVEERASGLNEAIGSEGGFLLETGFSLDLLNAGMAAARIAPRCATFPVPERSNSIELPTIAETSRATGSRFGGLQLHWLGEAGEKQASKPAFRKLKLELKKLVGLCYVTDELLADATVLEAFLKRAFASEFAFMVDDCILRGSGAGVPLGILNSPALVTVAAETGQAPATIVYANIVKMLARLPASSMGKAVWLVNPDTLPQLLTMSVSVGTGGAPVFVVNASGPAPGTLFGMPVIPTEQCSTLGQVGDILLCDFSHYLLATKGGLQTATSIHLRFAFDESVIRLVYRLDGMPDLSAPVTPYQGTASQSPFVALAARTE
jgi:HK97 family phage major capsid protein